MARRTIAILAVLTSAVLARAPSAEAASVLRLHHFRIADATTPGPSLEAAPLGRPIYVRVTLENVGTMSATGVGAHLTAPAFNVVIGSRDYGTIAPGGTATRAFLVTPARCPPNDLPVTVRASSDDASLLVSFTIPIICPRVMAASLAHTGFNRGSTSGFSAVLVLLGLVMRRASSQVSRLWPGLRAARTIPAVLRSGSSRTRSRRRPKPMLPRSEARARTDHWSSSQPP